MCRISVLADLKERLARTRLPDTEPEGAPWRYGTSLAYMRDVVDHWRDRYDWRAWEARINAFSHHKTTIGGKKIHFILERGSGDNPMPLLITHGWPGSFVEFLDIIEKLAHPERFGGDVRDAFTVVAPSLPGYGFSDPPDAPIGPRDIAADLEHADDGGARLRALRRAGRRLGRHHHLMACAGSSEEPAGDPPEHARAAAVRRQGVAAAQRRGEEPGSSARRRGAGRSPPISRSRARSRRRSPTA